MLIPIAVVLVVTIIVTIMLLSTDALKSDRELFWNYFAQNVDVSDFIFKNKLESQYEFKENNSYTSSGDLSLVIEQGENSSKQLNATTNARHDQNTGRTYAEAILKNGDIDLFKVSYINSGDIYAIKCAEVTPVYIGFRDGKPYEIFCGKSEDSFNIPKYVKDGFIIKEKSNGVSNYKFKYKDKHGYNIIIEGLNRCFNPEYWNYAIFVSLSLREHIPITTIVNQVSKLKLKDDYIGTWKNGMVRILSHLIPDGKIEGDKCPDCKQESLIRESGCVRCSNCGWSKCG